MLNRNFKIKNIDYNFYMINNSNYSLRCAMPIKWELMLEDFIEKRLLILKKHFMIKYKEIYIFSIGIRLLGI